MHYFSDELSYMALIRKNIDEYKKFQDKLFSDGFVKIISSLSSDNRVCYYVNTERKILVYTSLGIIDKEGIGSQLVSPSHDSKSFGTSFCHALTDENAEYMVEMLTFYQTLSDFNTVADKNNAFYMIAQTSQGLKKIIADCKPNPLKDDRFDLYYGKRFPIDKIKTFITDDTDQNLMLLHGDPGTGKSNLIRHLITYSTRNTIYIPPSMTASIASPHFIEFIMENRKSLIVIEDAEEILSKDRNSATNNLLGLTDGLLKDCLDLKIIATFNKNINDIDPALRRPGRLFFEYEFNKLSKNAVEDLIDFVGINIPSQDITDMTLAEIFGYGQELRIEDSLELRKIGFAV